MLQSPLIKGGLLTQSGAVDSFDPLGLVCGLSAADLRKLQEAECKHARLAMLAAIGWPIQEMAHPQLAAWTHGSNMLAEKGMSPSLLNGGLEQVGMAPALSLAVFVGSVLEMNELRARQRFGIDSIVAMLISGIFAARGDDDAHLDGPAPRQPGQLVISENFNAFGKMTPEQKRAATEAELLNGRLAMLAVTCYVTEEAIFRQPIVHITPALFEPLF